MRAHERMLQPLHAQAVCIWMHMKLFLLEVSAIFDTAHGKCMLSL